MKRILRSRWGLGLTLPLVFVLFTGILLPTPPGRSMVRNAVEFLSSYILNGTLTIERIDGSIYRRIQLKNIRLSTSDKDAFRADSIDVTHALGALLGGTIHLPAVEIDGLHLDWPALQSILPTSESSPQQDAPNSTRTIIIDRVKLDAPSIRLSPQEALTDLRLAASATITGSDASLAISRFEVKRDGVPFDITGRAVKAGDELRALSLAMRAGDATVHLHRPNDARAPIDVAGKIAWPAGTIPALSRHPILSSRANLDLRLTGTLDAMRLDLIGRLGRSQIRLMATGPSAPIRAQLRTQNLDLSKLHAAAPPSRLDTTITTTVSNIADTPEGHIDIQIAGTTQLNAAAPIVSIRKARVSALLRAGRVNSHLRLDTSFGTAWGKAQLSSFVAPRKVHGVDLHLEDIRLDELTMQRVSGLMNGHVHATGTLDAPKVDADLNAHALATDGFQWGDVEMLAAIEKRSDGLAARWSNLKWQAPSSVWTSTSGVVQIRAGRLSSPDFSFRSAHGVLRGRAHLDLSDPIGLRSTAALHLENFQLAALKGIHPSLRNAQGTLHGHVRVNGQQAVGVELDVRESQWSESWPETNARIRGTVGATAADVDIALNGRAWGRAQLKGKMQAPKAWREPSAWTAEPWTRLEHFNTTFDIDLHRLQPGTFRAGATQGAVTLGREGRRVRATVEAEAIDVEGLPRVSRLTLSAASKGRHIETTVSADVEDRPALRAEGIVHTNIPNIVARHWTQIPIDLTANIDRFPLALLNVTPLTTEPMTGRFSMEANLQNGKGRPKLDATAQLQQVELTPGAPPVNANVELYSDATTASVAATLDAPELGRHRLNLRARRPKKLDALGIARGIESLHYRGHGVQLAAVGELSQIDDLAGQIDMQLEGSPGLEQVRGLISARKAAVGKTVAPADIDLRLQQTSTDTTVLTDVRMGQSALLKAQVSSPITLLNALQPQYDWSSTPLRGFVISDGFSLKRALTDERQRKDIEGLLLLRADLEGTIAAPQIDATAQINAGRVGKTRFERFEARHSQNTGTRRTRLDIAQIDGGVLRARVDARDRTPFDLKVEAERFDIGFLATVSEMLNAGAAIEGMLNGTLAMDGDQTEGKLSASNLRVALPGAPPIERATLNIALADQQAKIDLRARSGPGRIQAEAIANTAPSATPTIKGRFVLDDVQVAGGGQIASVDLTGRILGQRQPSQFETEVVLTDGLIRLPDRNARNLHPITTRSDVVYQRSRWRGARPSSSRPPQPSALSFHVRTQKPIGVRGEPLDVIINTDIIARPQLRGMSVKGDARVEQGTVTLFGRRYTVDRTQVTLGGQVPPDPRIDILLSYEFNACTFFIGVGGPLSNPKLQLSAEPDIYDDKQLLGFLFGASPDEDNPDKTPQQQGVDAAAGVLLGQLQAQLKRNLPIDTLAVDLGDGTTSGQANVSLGKWLTDRLFVAYTYRHGAAQTENTSEGLLRYRFLHPWLVELVFGDRGNGAADLLWSKRW